MHVDIGMPGCSHYQRYQTEWQVIVVCSWPFVCVWLRVVGLAYIWRVAVGGTNLHVYTTTHTHECIPTCMHERERPCMFNYCTWSTETLGRPTLQTDGGNLEIDMIIAKLLPARSYCIVYASNTASNAACPLGCAFVHQIPIINIMMSTSQYFNRVLVCMLHTSHLCCAFVRHRVAKEGQQAHVNKCLIAHIWDGNEVIWKLDHLSLSLSIWSSSDDSEMQEFGTLDWPLTLLWQT